MSRAATSLTPTSGIAVTGSISCVPIPTTIAANLEAVANAAAMWSRKARGHAMIDHPGPHVSFTEILYTILSRRALLFGSAAVAASAVTSRAHIGVLA